MDRRVAALLAMTDLCRPSLAPSLALKALAKREHTVSFFCVSFYINKFLIIFVNIQIYSCLLV